MREGIEKYGRKWIQVSDYMAGAHTALQCFYRWNNTLKDCPVIASSKYKEKQLTSSVDNTVQLLFIVVF